MNRKIELLLILFLGFFLIAAIVYYVFFFSSRDIEPQVKNEMNNISQTVDSSKVIEPTEELVKTEEPVLIKRADLPLGQASLERMARSFAERFGSFSNQSNFANVTDLKIIMSRNMQEWADSYVQKNQKNNLPNDVYHGFTTKALSTNVNSFDNQNGRAEIVVETRRREATGTTNNASKLFNQKIIITFIKENQAWKVDSAYWQD